MIVREYTREGMVSGENPLFEGDEDKSRLSNSYGENIDWGDFCAATENKYEHDLLEACSKPPYYRCIFEERPAINIGPVVFNESVDKSELSLVGSVSEAESQLTDALAANLVDTYIERSLNSDDGASHDKPVIRLPKTINLKIELEREILESGNARYRIRGTV